MSFQPIAQKTIEKSYPAAASNLLKMTVPESDWTLKGYHIHSDTQPETSAASFSIYLNEVLIDDTLSVAVAENEDEVALDDATEKGDKIRVAYDGGPSNAIGDDLTITLYFETLVTDYIDFEEGAAPASPEEGRLRLYAKSSNSRFHQKDHEDNERDMAASGGSGSAARVVTVATNSDFGNAVVIPGLAVADRVQSSPSAEDDEFDDADTLPSGGAAKWSWENQGTSTVSISEDTSLLSLVAQDAQIRAITQPVPSGNWKITCRLINHMSLTADSWAGLVVLPSGSGERETCLFGKDGSAAANFRSERWNSSSSFNSQRAITTVGYNTLRFAWWYLQVEWNGTHLMFRYSPSGLVWEPNLVNFAPSFTPGRFGLVVRGTSIGGYFDFFRRS